jgi:hypothetical protein
MRNSQTLIRAKRQRNHLLKRAGERKNRFVGIRGISGEEMKKEFNFGITCRERHSHQ